MGGVHRAKRRQFFTQLQHFVGVSVERAGVGQTCGQAEGTRFEAFLQLLAHRRDFGGGGGAVQVVHMVAAQSGMANQCRDVEGRVSVFHRAR
jgi:hypothetical protein